MRRPALALIGVLLIPVAYLGTSWYVLQVMVTAERELPRRTEAELGFPDAERLSFETEDQVLLEGWLVPSAGERVIVLVHGIYSHAWDWQAPEVVRAYRNAGFDVFVFDLRGQGRSGGTLGLAWLERQDIRAAVNLLMDRGFKAGRIGVHGTSYGAAVAVWATAEIPEVGALVADSAFADLRDVMLGEVSRQTGIPLPLTVPLGPGLRLMARNRYGFDLDDITPEKRIGAITQRPILLIHGEQDLTIPVEAAQRLHRAAPTGTELWILPGRRHTEGVWLMTNSRAESPLREVFLGRVTRFFDDSLKLATAP